MESKLSGKRNLINLLQYREGNDKGGKLVKESCQFTDSLIKRLGLEHELQGHQGCVNCLQWTADGRHLASGSDDTNVILWDPFRHRQLQVIPTNHIGNIFSVKFLGTDNGVIATAAGDCRVLVQSVVARDVAPILDCGCHKNRVKRLATSPEDPSLFWSAGEDGLIMQYDLREQHECNSLGARVLIYLAHSIPYEVKCVAVNPTRPHYIAVGANDCYVRLYDRRMIKTCSLAQVNDSGEGHPNWRRRPDRNCVRYYAPGHMAVDNADVASFRFAATYVSFNAAGSEMLVNMGGEQIYLFDVNSERRADEIRVPRLETAAAAAAPPRKFKCSCRPEGNGYVKSNNNVHRAESAGGRCACFYMRRAYRCFRRRWMGDLYGAARDYLHVVRRWPDQTQAYVGLVKSLVALKWTGDAQRWLDHLAAVDAEFAGSAQVGRLRASIEKAKSAPPKEQADDEAPRPKELAQKIDEEETRRRLGSTDYEARFLGHCNTTTDIKEANFLGEDGAYVCAGSDEGIIFVWERKRSSIVSALFGDVSIVNCVQPHPSACLVASSGIDPVVKLWSPVPEDGSANSRAVKDIGAVVEANQRRMAMDPFESMLVNMGYQIQGPYINAGEGNLQEVPNCRTC